MAMKKNILFALLAIAVGASCRKSRTCDCTTIINTVQTTNNTSNTTTNTTRRIVTKNKQKKVDFIKTENCYGSNTSKTTIGGPTTQVVTTDITCTVK